jgi:hypothetical protein
MLAGERGAFRPVRGGAAPVEQPGGGQGECARAQRRDAAAPGVRLAQDIAAGYGAAETVGSTITVLALRIRPGPWAGRIWNPLSVVTGPRVMPHTKERYQGTPDMAAHSSPKTSQATPSSNTVTPSATTMATVGPSRSGAPPAALPAARSGWPRLAG